VLYDDGDYANASAKFLAAYELSRDPRLLWNVAACEKSQRHYAKAVGLVKRYLETGADLLTDDARKDALELLGAIESLTMGLSVTVDVPGAQIFVDGELVGSSPLPGPITIDIGTRQIEIRKPGFLPLSQSLPVGGTPQAKLDVKLQREVHEGELTVHAPAKATIFMDAKPVGVGRFAGTLPSGGHTLRVDSPGFRSYQSEVVLKDHDQRSIDVVLEPVAAPVAPPQEPEGPLHGLEFGLRVGYGVQQNRVDQVTDAGRFKRITSVTFIPWGIDLGYRLGRPTYLGIFGEYGPLDHSGTCGFVQHGVNPDFPGDTAVRFSYTSCTMFKVGVMLVFHVLPRTKIDPYFGFEAALHDTMASYQGFDPMTGKTGSGTAGHLSFQPGVQLGVDSHPTRELGVGIYAVLGPSFGQEGVPDCSLAYQDGCRNAGSPPGTHFVFGVRTAYTFE
jgi:hypothetical protein